VPTGAPTLWLRHHLRAPIAGELHTGFFANDDANCHGKRTSSDFEAAGVDSEADISRFVCPLRAFPERWVGPGMLFPHGRRGCSAVLVAIEEFSDLSGKS
jgi:hypothetical protein